MWLILSNEVRKIIARKRKNPMGLKFIDLFAGLGGFHNHRTPRHHLGKLLKWVSHCGKSGIEILPGTDECSDIISANSSGLKRSILIFPSTASSDIASDCSGSVISATTKSTVRTSYGSSHNAPSRPIECRSMKIFVSLTIISIGLY